MLCSNRDEYFGRPTAPVSLHEYNGYQVFAPQDLARSEHGTWIGFCPHTNKFAVLVNFRQDFKELVSPVSRGMLVLEFITSSCNNKLEFIALIKKKYGEDTLSKVGGFNLFFGDFNKFQFDIISNKTKEEFRVFQDSFEIHGLSNSSFSDPWAKVKNGELKLEKLINAYNENLEMNENDLINQLFELLSTNSLSNWDSQSYEELFAEIPNSIFVPPLKVDENTYYGTRTQTVVLVDKSMNLTYIEKTMHSSNDLLNELPQIVIKRFNLNSCPVHS